MIPFQLAVFLFAPALALFLDKRIKALSIIGPVAVCYAIGIALGNAPGLGWNDAFAMNAGGGAVLIAIPLLLFSCDVPAWLGSARPTLIASAIAFLSVAFVATLVGIYFAGRMDYAPEIAAGLSAVYSGGTANMVAISKALSYPPELFVMMNASDTLVSGPYYLFLSSVGHRFFGLFLRVPETHDEGFEALEDKSKRPAALEMAKSLGLAVLLTGSIYGAIQFLKLPQPDLLAVVFVSTGAIAVSFIRKVREMPASNAVGEYVLLIFCTAIGSLSDFSILASTDPKIIAFTASVFVGAQVLQYSLYRVFDIDRNTAMMASVASIYSPPFVGPVAARLKSKDALFTGVTIGLAGYAVAVYLGLIVAWLVRQFS